MMLGFAAFGPVIDVFAKLAGEAGIPVFQISGARFAVQVLILIPFALFYRALHLRQRQTDRDRDRDRDRLTETD